MRRHWTCRLRQVLGKMGEEMAENPKLTVLYEKLRGKTFELDKDQMSVGRKDSMDICIKDASMSGHHCDFIRTERGTYILRDNDSTNGTRINNIQITEQELKNSDIIQFGGVEVLYDCSDGSDPEATTGGFGGRTHTISLEDISGSMTATREAVNYSPFAGREKQKQKQARLILFAVIAVLAVALFGLLGWVVFIALTSGA